MELENGSYVRVTGEFRLNQLKLNKYFMFETEDQEITVLKTKKIKNIWVGEDKNVEKDKPLMIEFK